ncbi:TetR/AcrR family transcriptional regulator [Salinilacihabitans rarus]|uniref:TetR/AcrR family transcriptional regulator n=1 Tax=Salinilacihabitans rarus TaxID=2961596 RepID=UPI0020C8F793|nr:TetR/AcrR family transcriptional regulator [Salinilacihabitans rarus]
MDRLAEPFANPETSREEIFRATYRALADHGYADLSIQHIADRTSLSKSTIYHHFDGKDDLLMAFTERMLERYVEAFLAGPEGDPLGTLDRSLDLVLVGETADGVPIEEVQTAELARVVLELRAQAVRDPRVQDYFDATDRMIRDHIEALLSAAVEEGSLRDVDAERVAAVLYVILEGALVLRTTGRDAEWLRHVRAMVDDYLAGLKRES